MSKDRVSLYAQVTQRIVSELEQGRLPWVQPWDSANAEVGLPNNARTGRRYSSINVLILWTRVIELGFSSQQWLTFNQAHALGGHVRRGEQGTTICYADRFMPAQEQQRADAEGREARQQAFLKCFTVFNVAQCDGLPAEITVADHAPPAEELVPIAHRVMDATGAVIRIGGDRAFYSMIDDHIQTPHQSAYPEQINWYRTVLHELGHWSGHRSRLDRLTPAPFGSEDYFREELCAELASAFLCAELGIVPTVRHADYISAWIEVMKSDERAIFRAASHASRAAEFILACGTPQEGDDHVVL
jgi:antirestriction protein ArdC